MIVAENEGAGLQLHLRRKLPRHRQESAAVPKVSLRPLHLLRHDPVRRSHRRRKVGPLPEVPAEEEGETDGRRIDGQRRRTVVEETAIRCLFYIAIILFVSYDDAK
jgi:hypothetical protein